MRKVNPTIDKKNISINSLIDIMLDAEVPLNVIRHTNKVTEVAILIAEKLNEKDLKLDIQLIKRAGILHDIVREIGRGHDEKGADIVEKFDKKAAKIIREHMVHTFPKKAEKIKESDVVAIADRLTKMDDYASLKDREEEIISRNISDKTRVERIKKNFVEANDFVSIIENFVGKNIDYIVLGKTSKKKNVVNFDKEKTKEDNEIEKILGIKKPRQNLRDEIYPLLKDVVKPGRYVGGEINSVVKDNLNKLLRFGFVFPDLYEIGMSFTGLQILYKAVNDLDELYMERIFSVDFDFEKILRKKKLPLFTLETMTAATDLDVLGFTLQYELSYTNIINALDICGIPIFSSERDESHPLLIAGGIGSFNPKPLSKVFDLFNIGDGETMLPFILMTYKKLKDLGRSRKEILIELNKIKGVYIPSLYDGKEVHPARIADLNKIPYPLSPIIPNIEVVHDRAIIEIMRGCKRGCRFCQPGNIYKPVRERNVNNIVNSLFSNNGLIENNGFEEISLLSLSTSDYSNIKKLISKLTELSRKKNISLSLPSLRMDNFDEEFVRENFMYKKTGLTFAIEAGSEKLRKIINKDLSEYDILRTIVKIAKLGIKKIKLYFMVGLPLENYEDIRCIYLLVEKIIKVAELVLNNKEDFDIGEYNINGKLIRKPKKTARERFFVNVSVSNFVSKPHTPFQYFDANTSDELLRKNLMLKNLFKNLKGARYSFHDTKASVVENYISKGDEDMIYSILLAYKLGARFDAFREHFNFRIWDQVMEKFPGKIYKPTDSLPWDFVIPPVKKDVLLREANEAFKVYKYYEESNIKDKLIVDELKKINASKTKKEEGSKNREEVLKTKSDLKDILKSEYEKKHSFTSEKDNEDDNIENKDNKNEDENKENKENTDLKNNENKDSLDLENSENKESINLENKENSNKNESPDHTNNNNEKESSNEDIKNILLKDKNVFND